MMGSSRPHDPCARAGPARESDPSPSGDVGGPLDGSGAPWQGHEQRAPEAGDHPVIDAACGVLMVRFGCQPQEASDILAEVSEDAGMELGAVAEAVTASTTGQPMPTKLHDCLAAVVRKQWLGP
ncbi:ANTAR domain-containing protein [Streptomyces sp. NPDC101209]|uniref:ANTAR domain-containing protein n=1 Tax=Streptomyces sp. NPDC101209 TaxID=3366129 RepID=UPI0038051B2E